MFVRLYDGNNAYRLQLETDPTGLTPRSMYNDVQSTDDVCIFVWDGFRHNERRRALYPDYKMKRKPAGEDIFAGIRLLRDVLKHSKAIQVEVPEYEADDVIATLTLDLVRKGQKVQIYSNDFDLFQLTALPGVVCGARQKDDVRPELVRLYKTFVGDPSDNISGVPLFGAKTWDRCDKDHLLEVVYACRLGTDADLTKWLDQLGLKPAISNWIRENRDTVAAMWAITGFYEVPTDLINKHSIAGRSNPKAAYAMLSEFFL